MSALRLLVAGVLILGVVAAAWAADKDEKKAAKVKVTREKLAGTWVGKPPRGKGTITVAFTRDGRTSLVHKAKTPEGDKEGRKAGTYKIDGDKIKVTIEEETVTLTVTKLTDTELVLKTPKGDTITYKKVKAKAKGK
jgi:uncharacterized protein (TIGR03066 family)